jgi:hypothetical protein
VADTSTCRQIGNFGDDSRGHALRSERKRSKIASIAVLKTGGLARANEPKGRNIRVNVLSPEPMELVKQ